MNLCFIFKPIGGAWVAIFTKMGIYGLIWFVSCVSENYDSQNVRYMKLKYYWNSTQNVWLHGDYTSFHRYTRKFQVDWSIPAILQRIKRRNIPNQPAARSKVTIIFSSYFTLPLKIVVTFKGAAGWLGMYLRLTRSKSAGPLWWTWNLHRTEKCKSVHAWTFATDTVEDFQQFPEIIIYWKSKYMAGLNIIGWINSSSGVYFSPILLSY